MIIGHALISDDGYIADAHGSMQAIAHPYDFRLLQRRLHDTPGISVMGRVTHECHPNTARRKRYILSHAEYVSHDPVTFFKNKEALLERVTAHTDETHHILGGSALYTLFGENRLYDAFYLSIRTNVALKTGKPIDARRGFVDSNKLMNGWNLLLTGQETSAAHPDLRILRYTK